MQLDNGVLGYLMREGFLFLVGEQLITYAPVNKHVPKETIRAMLSLSEDKQQAKMNLPADFTAVDEDQSSLTLLFRFMAFMKHTAEQAAAANT